MNKLVRYRSDNVENKKYEEKKIRLRKALSIRM